MRISDWSSYVCSSDLLWTTARDRFGAGGPYLFGAFGAADIMFAPVVTRFVTYSIRVSQPVADYMTAMLQHPFMEEWVEAASEEPWILEKLEPGRRSEERRVGKACVSKCRFRWSRSHKKKKK